MNIIEPSDSLDGWYVLRGDCTLIEGTAAEWRAIFDAMRDCRYLGFSRLAVTFTPSGATFSSPRNRYDADDGYFLLLCEFDDFIALGEQILIANEGELIGGDGI